MNICNIEHAKKLHSSGKIQEANEIYIQLLKENSSDLDLLQSIAISCSQLQQYSTAHQHIDKAISLSPKNITLLHTKAMILQQQQLYPEAIKHYKAALKISPNYTQALLNLGTIAYRQQKLETAQNHYKKILSYSPNNSQAHFNLGLIATQNNELKQAITHFTATLTVQPEHARSHGQLGNIYLTQEHYQEATEHFLKRLELEPQNAQTWHSLGQAQLKLKHVSAAIESFENCLAHDSKHPQVNQDLANALLMSEDYSRALSYYFKQLQIDPLPESYYNIGVLLMYQEKNQEAIEYIKQAIVLDPNNLSCHINLASIYLKTNCIIESTQHYEKALEIDPNNQEIQYILAAINNKTPPKRAPNEYLQNLFDQYANHYDKHLVEVLKYNVPSALLNLFETHYPDRSNLRVLDLGCGTGLGGEHFREISKHLIGVDISEKMLERARSKQLYDELILADIHEVLIKQKDIDLIIAADVFSYSGDLNSLIQQCHSSLNEGGVLAFSVECLPDNSQDYALQPSIRYAHSKNYIKKVLNHHQFKLMDITNSVLRLQNKQSISGHLIIFEKKILTDKHT